MSKQRHPSNTNLKLVHSSTWSDLPVLQQPSGLVDQYLHHIQQTLIHASTEYARLCVMRFDLRFPQSFACRDSQAISRFVDALKAKISADQQRKQAQDKRIYPCRLRYVWVKEQADSEACHYHMAIILNRDAYFTLGNYAAAACSADPDMPVDHSHEPPENMAGRIVSAWASALDLTVEQAVGLVHFPENPVYRVDRKAEAFSEQYHDVFKRLSYFAKAETKQYGDRSRHFGYSLR